MLIELRYQINQINQINLYSINRGRRIVLIELRFQINQMNLYSINREYGLC